MKQFSKIFMLAFITSAASFFLFSGTSHAATLTVAAGNDETTTNSSCSLSEAITNINDQAATYPDCAAGDGTNDTITLPAGTITLTNNPPTITRSLTLQGQGMADTIINGNAGQYWGLTFTASASELFTVQDLKITAINDHALFGQVGDYEIHRVDVDGTASDTNMSAGVVLVAGLAVPSQFSLSDIYVHDFAEASPVFQPIVLSTSNSIDTTAQADNITIARITNSAGQVNTFSLTTNTIGTGGTGNISGLFRNVTISDISSSAGLVSGVGAIAFGEANNATLTIDNVTIAGMNGVDSFTPGVSAAGLFSAGTGFVSEAHTTASLVVSNVISSTAGCFSMDISPLVVGAGGASSPTITSQGGNLSDDNSCSTYFTQSTDQNNVAALAASLLPLADNGGYVPTMALKEGSPAIDSGITIAGLTTDARGITRPQGTAYDSGAYESPYSKPATPTLAKSGESIIFIGLGAVTVLALGYATTQKRAPFKQNN